MGKINFYKQISGGEKEESPKSKNFYRKIQFHKTAFPWKAVQLGSSWKAVRDAGGGMLGRRCFH